MIKLYYDERPVWVGAVLAYIAGTPNALWDRAVITADAIVVKYRERVPEEDEDDPRTRGSSYTEHAEDVE